MRGRPTRRKFMVLGKNHARIALWPRRRRRHVHSQVAERVPGADQLGRRRAWRLQSFERRLQAETAACEAPENKERVVKRLALEFSGIPLERRAPQPVPRV